jgi:hypothetical protein
MLGTSPLAADTKGYPLGAWRREFLTRGEASFPVSAAGPCKSFNIFGATRRAADRDSECEQ